MNIKNETKRPLSQWPFGSVFGVQLDYSCRKKSVPHGAENSVVIVRVVLVGCWIFAIIHSGRYARFSASVGTLISTFSLNCVPATSKKKSSQKRLINFPANDVPLSTYKKSLRQQPLIIKNLSLYTYLKLTLKNLGRYHNVLTV